MNWFKRLFIEQCPNCLGADQLGIDDTSQCIVCSDPRTGKSRGWVWRSTWLHNHLVYFKNFDQAIGGKSIRPWRLILRFRWGWRWALGNDWYSLHRWGMYYSVLDETLYVVDAGVVTFGYARKGRYSERTQ